MTNFTFYKGYQNNQELRKSFNELAALVFGLNFEEWYKKSYWNNRYIPFSYLDGRKVIANVSVNLLDFVVNGEKKKVVQLGTVMTHPDFRNQELSARLLDKVLEEYENKYDFIYLFANQEVLDFYPKFGFQSVTEYQFSMDYASSESNGAGIRKLDGQNSGDLEFIYRIASERLPVSNLFGTRNAEGIVMFHCLFVFENDIYYIEEQEAVVIFKAEGRQVDIFDIISKKEVCIHTILSKIITSETKRIIFHYTPDYQGIITQCEIFKGDEVLFVKGNDRTHLALQVKHPVTSQA